LPPIRRSSPNDPVNAVDKIRFTPLIKLVRTVIPDLSNE
jgi:hypothetical protein